MPKENQVGAEAPKAQLYDLSVDPAEQNNQYTSKPAVAEKLLKQLTEDIANGRSTPGIESKNDVADIVLWKSENSKKAIAKQSSSKKKSGAKAKSNQ